MATEQPTKKAAPVAVNVAPTVASTTNGIAIASLVVGIFAFIFGWVPFLGFAAGATAIILGVIALKKHAANKGLPVAGITTGALGALWSIILSIIFIIGIAALSVGGAAASTALGTANKALSQYTAANQVLVNQKKDFNKGDTATFGNFEVKVNSVTRNYNPNDSYNTPDPGSEFIAVNITAKNVASDSQSISQYDFKINEAGNANAATFVTDAPAFDGGDLDSGASTTGNIVYQVTAGATDLKLQYTVIVYDVNSGVKTLVYTVGL